MKSLPLILVLLAVALGAFGWWGMHTEAGRRRFDEMAGMLPMGALALAPILVIAAAVAWWLSSRGR